MPSVVLAATRAPAGKGCRPCPLYLCQVSHMIANPSMPASGRLPRVGSATLAGQLSGGARTWRPAGLGNDPTEQELDKGTGRVSYPGADPTELELRN
ncbi:hypothetical protein B296_00000342 [Ensete ventricosum]|uniref:Uncharacterized protein n=1 Tax=Ensete ventricosum TaxID=4639 RepID=A0A427B2Q1_ENSVE|nr:hypothetical protein B296_00000342 [Ensete ventricosum]